MLQVSKEKRETRIAISIEIRVYAAKYTPAKQQTSKRSTPPDHPVRSLHKRDTPK